jgi:hypothetical protein
VPQKRQGAFCQETTPELLVIFGQSAKTIPGKSAVAVATALPAAVLRINRRLSSFMVTSHPPLVFIIAEGQAERLQRPQLLQPSLERFFTGMVRCIGNKYYYVVVYGGNNPTIFKCSELGAKILFGSAPGNGEITENRHGDSEMRVKQLRDELAFYQYILAHHRGKILDLSQRSTVRIYYCGEKIEFLSIFCKFSIKIIYVNGGHLSRGVAGGAGACTSA